LAALYDGVLGLAFLFSAPTVFQWYAVVPPNHMGYVQFPAALLIVFAILFFNLAKDPEKNRNLIIYGALLKVSYCSIVFYYWAATDIPNMWKPFAVFDLLFLLLFIAAYRALRTVPSN
jgi:hypothetical protein